MVARGKLNVRGKQYAYASIIIHPAMLERKVGYLPPALPQSVLKFWRLEMQMTPMDVRKVSSQK